MDMTTCKESIKFILMDNLDYVYCDTCKFNNLSKEECINMYGYYSCDICHDKFQCWEISDSKASQISEEILKSLEQGDYHVQQLHDGI